MRPDSPNSAMAPTARRARAAATTQPRRAQQVGVVQPPLRMARRLGAEVERLRRRLAAVEAALEEARRRQAWLESDLAAQRHARQLLEATVAANYSDMPTRIRNVVRALVPPGAIVLVVSRGDPELIELGDRTGWHFPRAADGQYAGYHPEDSAAAIAHLQALITQGARFLVLPGTSFWWLEHYRDWQAHLDQCHERLWRDDRCIVYRLRPAAPARPGRARPVPNPAAKPAARARPKRTARSPHDVVCFPIINWDYRFQRPQQLMLQFAAAGHRVFYLSHEFLAGEAPYQRRERAAHLDELCLRGPRFPVRGGVLDDDACAALFVALAALQRDLAVGPAVAVVQSAFWWPLVRRAAAAFGWPVVYDCLDHHAGFAGSDPWLEAQERELLAQAGLVVASSAVLEAEARRHNRRVVLVRNGCNYEHFARIGPPPRGPRPVIGYFGAIAEWFDVPLVAELARRRSDWDFVLVGSTSGADVCGLECLPNVRLPGEQPYAEIPDWLATFDVAILPFRRTPLTEATNPVKAYEIFAAGRPMVAVPLPEMRRLRPLVRLASTADEFEAAIEEELRRPNPKLDARRRAFARANTWRKRFEQLAPAIRRLLSRVGFQVA